MATKRRGGFGTPELRGTLGTLLRTTTGVVRDVLERGAREGRARFDDARANRHRQDALAELGELVLDLIRRGEIDLAELPEARDLVRQLDELDADSAGEPEPPRAQSRNRFDDRARRPTPAPTDDGTVSSGAVARASRPARPGLPKNSDAPSTRAPTKPIRDSWRPSLHDGPPLDDVPTLTETPAARRSAPHDIPPVTEAPVTRRSAPHDVPTLAEMPAAKRSLLHDPHRRGGISFEDDDLHEYMHPDDVPPKGPSKNPGDGDA